MRIKIYNILVNKHPGIKERYHRFHDGSKGVKKAVTWLYLFWLNFCYYILFCHFLDQRSGLKIYEEKKLPLNQSESALAAQAHTDVNSCVEKLMQYDIISFDIFDTLIYRPFSEPADLFFFVGAELGILDFKRIRMQMEAEERETCRKERGHTEITLADIWKRMERESGIPAEEGSGIEQEMESRFCYANPYMLRIFQELKQRGKQIVVISDMYLPEVFLHRLLEKNGYHGISRLYVSCEYQKNKAEGGLFELVKGNFPENAKIIHVGDSPVSDIQMAQKQGWETLYYPNADRWAKKYRAYDMSPLIGGAYRGIVNHYLYNGSAVYGMEYEYGFIYGGLFVVGYCHFIHEYCRQHQIDKLLFLSRDGDILKQVYDRLYPQDHTSYVYWSRTAAVKLMAEHDRYDYFRRFLYHKVNQKKTIREILASMELEPLADELDAALKQTDFLTDKNAEILKCFLQQRFGQILTLYQEQSLAAKDYYARELAGCRKACAIDIGWAGSGAVSLSYLVERCWKLSCEITGIVAGTNTLHNAEPDASENFLQSGKLVSYLFSQSHNRDIMKKHDLNRDYNVYWELLLASPTEQFVGFGYAADEKGNKQVKLHFGRKDFNQEGIKEIQRGILDFSAEYMAHFEAFPYMAAVSGRDAYAPMLLAAGHKEQYLRRMAEKFALDVNVS